MKRTFSILFLSGVLLISCDRPNCRSENQVFNTNESSSNEYVLELFKQLESSDRNNLTYWIKGYEKIGVDEFLNIYLQGSSLCAQTRMLVRDWSNLKVLRKMKGKGYSGASIENLELELKESEETWQFMYVSHSAIID
ncbi:MAG: hypothetical protein ACJATE_000717 [Bacteroidia bacterium]|jgi:hypothetical protein